MKRRADDRARYRERDYYPNNNREEYDSYRGGVCILLILRLSV
jgi:hypothetical protein